MTLAGDTVDAGVTDLRLWLPLSEAARQQNPPVSRAAMHKRVSKLVGAGRLSTRPGPRGTVLVNIVALNRAIATETDPAQALRNGIAPAEDDDETRSDPEQVSGAPSYHASRASREAYQAENARLDLEERLGNSLDAQDVERRTMTVMRKMRDRLLALPAMAADELAGAPDVRTVRALLTEKLRGVLNALADDLDKLSDEDEDGLDDDDDDGPGADEPVAGPA